jgi:hypothetical protein
MNRKLKALGLSLVAVFAMSAVVASSASAATDLLTTTKASALMTGVGQNHIFNITGVASFQCTTSKFTATATNNSSEVTVDPEYSGKVNETPHGTGCTASLGSATEVRTNGCHYKLSGVTVGGSTTVGGDGPVWIVCPGTSKIEIASSLGVTISIPSQTPTAGGVSYVNVPNHPGGSAVQVKATAEGITYTCAPVLTCAIGGIAMHGNNADYSGAVTMTGYEDTDGLPTPITEGVQIPIEVS